MTLRRTIMLAALALAVAIAVVSSGSAAQTNAKRTHRSVTGSLSGVGTPGYALPPGNSFGGELTGVISPLGRVAYHVEGTFAKNQSGVYDLEGTTIIVTRNGRSLIGTFHATTRTGVHVAATIHITGGNGRFAGAHGTWTMTGHNTPTPGKAFPNLSEAKVKGHISY